jgi:hypothetical protein
MAQYHLSGHAVITRAKGQKVVRSAAYAAGERLQDDRYGEVHDFTRRRHVLDVVMVVPQTAPDWARDRQQFWNAVERKEKRKDSQLAIPYDIALPYELTLEQNIALIREYAKTEFADRGLVADVAIHRPDPRRDPRNIHAHILIPTRPIDEDGLGPKIRNAGTRQSWEQEREENILRLRESWAEHHNRHMAAAGFDSSHYIDHRSLEDQGIAREPTTHRGVAADHMEQRGLTTDRGDDYRNIQAENEKRALRKRKRKDYAEASEASPMPDAQSPQDKIAEEAVRKEQERQDAASKEQQEKFEKDKQAEIKRLDDLGKAYRERIEALCLAAQQKEQQVADPDRHREYIIAYQAEQKLDYMRAREELHRAQAMERTRSLGGPIQSPHSRYTEALAQNYNINDPWQSLAKAALHEHAAFRREQDNLAKQIDQATDPALRKGLILRQAIEGYEYLATTGERIAKMSEIVSGRLVNGKLVSEESTRMRALIHHEENGYNARASALRKELRELRQEREMPPPAKEKAATKEKDKQTTREYRPRGRRADRYDDLIKKQDDAAKAREAERLAKMTEAEREKEREKERQRQRERERER